MSVLRDPLIRACPVLTLGYDPFVSVMLVDGAAEARARNFRKGPEVPLVILSWSQLLVLMAS